MLLNTDWTERDNEKTVTVRFGGGSYDTTVKEREALIITIKDGEYKEERYTL